MAKTFSEDRKAAIRCMVDSGVTRVSVICDRLGIGTGHVAVKKYRDEHLASKGGAAPPAAVPSPERMESFEESGDTAKVSCIVGSDGIVTEEDLVRVCKIDMTRWRVGKMAVKAYQAGMKIGVREVDGKGVPRLVRETPHVVQLFSVAAELERVIPRREMDAAEALFARLGRQSPLYPPTVLSPAWRPELVADIDLFDVHFGNLAWQQEAGENDDLRIKESVFRNAIEDLIARTAAYPIEEVIFPIGNDLHHVDTLLRTTTAGTPQDADGRYAKMIEVTQAAVIWGIDRLLAIPGVGRVRVIYMPGNHDKLTSYHLCLTLSAWFRNCDRVAVDTRFRVRKYLEYGRCFFGYTHGDHTSDSRLKELPLIMAVEEREAWGRTTCREIKTGHRHTSQSFTTLASSEFNGVMVRRLSALTGPNAYHFDHGYIGNRRAAEVYLYDPSEGFIGQFVAPARAA